MATMTSAETRETTSLIGSDKVEGTAVYGADHEKIGSIERVMIDKISGKVAYAVLSFGGFLGMGEDYYPVPWATLKYDTKLGGYVLGLTRDELEQAPNTPRAKAGTGLARMINVSTTTIGLSLIGVESTRSRLCPEAAPLSFPLGDNIVIGGSINVPA